MTSDKSSSILLLQENEQLKEQQVVFREILVELSKENAALREDNESLAVQNAAYLQQLQETQKKKQENQSSQGEVTPVVVEELQATIEDLQQRVIVLVHEKLSMHTLIETLEHELELMSSHAMPRKVSKSKIIKETSTLSTVSLQEVDNAKHTQECLQRARREQLEQLLLDDTTTPASCREKSMYDNAIIALGEYDIQKELEEQLNKRTTALRPQPDSVSENNVFFNDIKYQDDHLRNVSSHNINKDSTQSKFQPKGKEHKENLRSRLWTGRIGRTPAKDSPPKPVLKPLGLSFVDRRVLSNTIMVMDDDDDGSMEYFNSRRESGGPVAIEDISLHSTTNPSSSSGKRTKSKKNDKNRNVATPYMNLLI